MLRTKRKWPTSLLREKLLSYLFFIQTYLHQFCIDIINRTCVWGAPPCLDVHWPTSGAEFCGQERVSTDDSCSWTTVVYFCAALFAHRCSLVGWLREGIVWKCDDPGAPGRLFALPLSYLILKMRSSHIVHAWRCQSHRSNTNGKDEWQLYENKITWNNGCSRVLGKSKSSLKFFGVESESEVTV